MALRVVFMTPAMSAMRQTLVRSMSSQSAGEPKNVGFIGLGNMGYAMSSNLMSKGHKLHVYDIAKEPTDKLKAKGAAVYGDVAELASNSDFVITMLPNNPIVLDTYTKMVGQGVTKDTMFVDSSTIDPNLAKDLRSMVAEKGAVFIDAPVSGGVPGAEKATLTFMVGGSKADYEKVTPILKCMGQLITHCGDIGMGQAAKLCNNMMLGISMIGVCETMNLAIRLGLDPKTFAAIINASTGRCWASDSYNPVPGITPTAPANNDYQNGFSCELITKDLGLASGVATASNTPIPLGAAAHQVYRFAKSKGFGKKDFSYIYEMLRNEKNN